MQPLRAVSRTSTKVTISQNQTAQVFVNNELLMFAVSIRAILSTSFRAESPILSDNLTILFCSLNDWNHRYQSRLKYSKSCEKYPNTTSRPKYIGISKFSLVS